MSLQLGTSNNPKDKKLLYCIHSSYKSSNILDQSSLALSSLPSSPFSILSLISSNLLILVATMPKVFHLSLDAVLGSGIWSGQMEWLWLQWSAILFVIQQDTVNIYVIRVQSLPILKVATESTVLALISWSHHLQFFFLFFSPKILPFSPWWSS